MSEDSNQPQDAPSDAEQKPEKAVTFSYGIVMIRTRRLLSILDKLAKYRIFGWLGWVFLAITIGSGAFMLWLMLDQDYIVLTSSFALRCAVGAATVAQCQSHGLTQSPGPALQAYLLLPGINPFIPIVYGLIGIILAVVIHEGTHGVLARSFKLPVKATGVLLFLIVPIGAFVEIDEKLIQKTRFRNSGRIMAGGPGSNIIVALIALGLLLLLIGSLAPAQFNGVYVGSVVAGSPAATLYQNHYLQAGDVIVAINGTQLHSVANLSNYLANTRPNETVVLSVDHNNQLYNYSIVLAKYPVANVTKGFIGIQQSVSSSDLVNIKNSYSSAFFSRPLLYLIVPGIVAQADQVVPFSNALNGLYTSPTLGSFWYPAALTLFWIWFINVNLAFFNAIPLYPLDGGQAMLNFFTHFGKKWVEVRAKALTTVISLVMFAIILSFLFLPRLLAFIPVG
ncbi:MAG: site-2 protease family protein [Nitrososphaerales archaeon]